MKTISFWEFTWTDRQNQKALFWALGLSIASFTIFKILYPYPDFFSDSYSYIFAASANLDVSIWPIGYSKFLSIFHFLTYSDTALVAFQYFFMQMSAIIFFYTVLYFYNTSETTRKVLFVFLFVNPLSLYLCNTINSDALFAALSLLWFTQLIWMLYKPKFHQIIIQAILLFLCFTIRNNAYFYPLISVLVILLSRNNWKIKALAVALPFLLILPFVIHTRNEAYKSTGTHQFSLFTGWQLANNALYIYDKIDVDSATLPTPQSRELNRLAISFLQNVQPEEYRQDLESYVGNYFIKEYGAPLKRYYRHHFRSGTEIQSIADWGKASAIFEPFGKHIIIHHPIAYARYFMWPNTFHYILPPLSHIEIYNYGENDIDPIAQNWFHYPKPEVHCISHKLQGLLIAYEALFLLFNLYFVLQLYLYIRKYKMDFRANTQQLSYLIAGSFLFLNFAFSVFATLNILRYQVIPMFVLLTFGLLISDFLEETAWNNKKITNNILSDKLATHAESHA